MLGQGAVRLLPSSFSVSLLTFSLMSFSISRGVIAGGGAPEVELSVRLNQHALTLTGVDAYCYKYEKKSPILHI